MVLFGNSRQNLKLAIVASDFKIRNRGLASMLKCLRLVVSSGNNVARSRSSAESRIEMRHMGRALLRLSRRPSAYILTMTMCLQCIGSHTGTSQRCFF